MDPGIGNLTSARPGPAIGTAFPFHLVTKYCCLYLKEVNFIYIYLVKCLSSPIGELLDLTLKIFVRVRVRVRVRVSFGFSGR